MRSKKYLKLSVGVFILLFVVLPYFIGIIFEHRYEKTLHLLAQNMKMNLKLVEYKRGWFHSNAILAANFPLADKPLDIKHIHQDTALIITQEIYHGPIVFYSNSYHRGIKIALTFIDSYLNKKHFADTTIALNSSLLTNFDLKQLLLQDHNIVLYSIENLTGSFWLSAKQQKFDASIRISKLVSNVATPRAVSEFSTTLQLRQDVSGLWMGQRVYHFGSLNWHQDNKQLEFKNFTTIIQSKPFDQQAEVQIISSVQDAKFNNKDYGPQYVSFLFTHLNKKELKRVSQYMPMTNSIMPAGDARNFQKYLGLLLTKGAELKIENLSFNTAWGPINLKADIACPCQQNPYPISVLMIAATGQIRGHLPKELANNFLKTYYTVQEAQPDEAVINQKVQAALTDWQNLGWLIPSKEEYLIYLNWQNKAILPNNKNY